MCKDNQLGYEMARNAQVIDLMCKDNQLGYEMARNAQVIDLMCKDNQLGYRNAQVYFKYFFFTNFVLHYRL